MSDAINPDHYKRLPAEAIEIIESAIDSAPSNQDAYLHGQVLKYILRCWSKNGIEDLKKAKWYLDRLIDLADESEQQKAADLQSLKDHPFGKLKQPAWAPKVGEWVRIKKPADTQASATSWWRDMDKYNGQIIQVKEIDGDGVVQDGWGFVFDWLEPAEQPKATGEVAGEVAGEVNPPDGWRWLEVGEMIRKGDKYRDLKSQTWIEYVVAVGDSLHDFHKPTIRRNRFEVGEKVVHGDRKSLSISVVENILGDGWVDLVRDGVLNAYHVKDLAPYIE